MIRIGTIGTVPEDPTSFLACVTMFVRNSLEILHSKKKFVSCAALIRVIRSHNLVRVNKFEIFSVFFCNTVDIIK